MYGMSETRQKALARAQNYFRSAMLHPSTIAFREKIIHNSAFIEGGLGQWLREDLDTLRQRRQRPVTVNLVRSLIDNISGVEVQSRYRNAVRTHSFDENDQRLAEALTYMLYFIQEDQKIPYKGSLKFRDALIYGLGWSHISVDENGYSYDYVNPYNVLPDPDDLSSQFENMKYVCRKIWMSPDRAKFIWRKLKDIDYIEDPNQWAGVISQEMLDRTSPTFSLEASALTNFKKMLIVEVQYKIPHKAFCGFDRNGRSFETFDLEKAEYIAEKKSAITEKKSERIMRTLFSGNTVIEHSPLDFVSPASKDFSYIPLVWQRSFKDGVPYGILDCMIDIQRDCNVRMTKSIYNINSKQVIYEGAFEGQTVEYIKNELKTDDAVIVLPPDSKYNFTSNAPLGEQQMKVVEFYLQLLQRVSGIHDEMLGVQTNATSALAQNVRQVNSVRNNVFGFDSFAYMKKREALFMLDAIQSKFDANIAVAILDQDQIQTIILNLETDEEGVLLNDIRTLPVSLYVEEVPDYRSSREEQKAMIESLLGNAQAHWLMMSPELLRLLGFRQPERLVEEMKKALQEKSMTDQAVAGRTQQMQQMQQASPVQPIQQQ